MFANCKGIDIMKNNTIDIIIKKFTKTTKLGQSIWNISFNNIAFFITILIGSIGCWNCKVNTITKLIVNIYIIAIVIFIYKAFFIKINQ